MKCWWWRKTGLFFGRNHGIQTRRHHNSPGRGAAVKENSSDRADTEMSFPASWWLLRRLDGSPSHRLLLVLLRLTSSDNKIIIIKPYQLLNYGPKRRPLERLIILSSSGSRLDLKRSPKNLFHFLLLDFCLFFFFSFGIFRLLSKR